MSVEGPVIIDEHGALEAHSDVGTAILGLEAIDVLNDGYEAFDAHGEPLDLLVLDQQIVLRRRVDPEIDRADVAGRLRRAARVYEPSQLGDLDIEQADLNELVLHFLRSSRCRSPEGTSCHGGSISRAISAAGV